MNITTFIAGVSLIAGTMQMIQPAPRADMVTPWGTHIVYDDARVHRINAELYRCLSTVATWSATTGPEGLKVAATQICNDPYWAQLRISENPPTFYGLTGTTEDGGDQYGEFATCSASLASPMWDFPPEATTEEFRASIYRCLATFPKQ